MTFIEAMYRMLLMIWQLVFVAVLFGALVGALSVWIPQRIRDRRELRAGCPEWEEVQAARAAREIAHVEELAENLGHDTVPLPDRESVRFATGVVKVGADQ